METLKTLAETIAYAVEYMSGDSAIASIRCRFVTAVGTVMEGDFFPDGTASNFGPVQD